MNKSEKKGITLISLIITVIILIILSGVVITFAGEGKIFDATKETVNKSKKQSDDKDQMVNEVKNLYK